DIGIFFYPNRDIHALTCHPEIQEISEKCCSAGGSQRRRSYRQQWSFTFPIPGWRRASEQKRHSGRRWTSHYPIPIWPCSYTPPTSWSRRERGATFPTSNRPTMRTI